MTLSRLAFCACTLAFAALLTGAGHAADRGLALTIGAPRGQPALPGVVRDRANARTLYNRLGFNGPLRELAEAQLGLPGLRNALDRLVRDTRPGDRVFLYFSGYGAAQRGRGGACGATWLAHDARPLPPAELQRAFAALSRRAGQVVVVVDASVAAAPRGAKGPARAKTARVASHCAPAGPWPSVPEAAHPDGGLVLLAAARAGEPAFDVPASGGVASQALLACLAQPGFARNPLADFDDLHRCTADRMAGVPQHPVLAGNAGLPVQPQLAVMVPPSAETGRESAVAALHRAAANADTQWRVSVTPVGAAVGRDAPAMAVTSDRAGFLYIVRAGTEASDLGLVYPQRPDESNQLRAGEVFSVPRVATDGQWMVLVSEQPLRAGDLLVRLGLAHFAAAACLRNLGSDDCPSPAAGVAEPPALRFGATLLSADGRTVIGR